MSCLDGVRSFTASPNCRNLISGCFSALHIVRTLNLELMLRAGLRRVSKHWFSKGVAALLKASVVPPRSPVLAFDVVITGCCKNDGQR